MGFLIHGPGGAVKLYFSVPVGMYSVFLRPSRTVHCFLEPKTLVNTLVKNLAKTLVKNLAKNLVKHLIKIWPKSRHADHVLKTQVYEKLGKTSKTMGKATKTKEISKTMKNNEN